MLRHNLEEFRRRARAESERIEEDWLEGAVEIGVGGYAALVEKTEATGSVDTGAFRAEHVIEQGGRFVYESPDRVGPDTPLPSQKKIGQPPIVSAPSLGDVRAALESALRLGPFGFANRRFYGPFLEDGTSQIEPRHIYRTSEDATEKLAERVAASISQRRERTAR